MGDEKNSQQRNGFRLLLHKTLVLFLHTTKVPEATRGKSAPNKQTIVYNTTKKVLSVSIFVMTFRMRCPFSDP